MNKPIIYKIRYYQSIVKNKSKTALQRQKAYLELKRLNSLKEPGNVVKMPDYKMINVNPKTHKPYEHNYLIFNTDKKNNTKVNKITHGNISFKYSIPNFDAKDNRKQFIGLKIIDSYSRKDKKDKQLKYYDFYESNLNGKLNSEIIYDILNNIKSTPINANKI